MRRASLASFLLAIPLYTLSFYLTFSSLSGGFDRRTWLLGRATSICAVVLLVASVTLAFLAPPLRIRSRMWWVVPATVIAIAVVYFDFVNIGFRL